MESAKDNELGVMYRRCLEEWIFPEETALERGYLPCETVREVHNNPKVKLLLYTGGNFPWESITH